MEVVFMLHCQNKAAVNIHVPFFLGTVPKCSLLHVGVYLVFKKNFQTISQSDYASLFQWQCLKDLFLHVLVGS